MGNFKQLNGDGLIGGIQETTHVPPPPIPSNPGRRQADFDVANRAIKLETQMAVVELQMTHLGERIEETSKELKEDIKRLDDRVSEEVNQIREDVRRIIEDHEISEREHTESRIGAVSAIAKRIEEKGNERHQSLIEIAGTLNTIKGGAVKVGIAVIIGGFSFTISGLWFLLTHLDMLSRIMDNLTR